MSRLADRIAARLTERLTARLSALVARCREHFAGKLDLPLPYSYVADDTREGIGDNAAQFEAITGRRPAFMVAANAADGRPRTDTWTPLPYSNMAWRFPRAESFLELQETAGARAADVAAVCTLRDDLPCTIGFLLDGIEADAASLVSVAVWLVRDSVERFVGKERRAAVLDRPLVAERWPWPLEHEAGAALHLLAHLVPPAFEAERMMHGWWREVAAADLARWISEAEKSGETRIGETLIGEIQDDKRDPSTLIWCAMHQRAERPMYVPFGGLATLFLAERAVHEDQRRPSVAIDAGRPHHDFVALAVAAPKDARKPQSFTRLDGGSTLQLVVPSRAIQLSLPLGDEELPEAIVHAVKAWRGPMGLRHWAAILRSLSIEGSRLGWFRWTLKGHMEALGYSKRQRERPVLRAEIARDVELLTQAELAVLDKDGRERERRPLLHVGKKFDRLEGSEWRLDGMELRINPRLYNGVRDETTGKLGTDWWPAPPAIAQINQKTHPHAIGLGLVLCIRWRWDWLDGRDHLALSGRNLLETAGIRFEPRKPSRSWTKLERTLEELCKRECLGRWTWDDGAPSLAGICRLWPAQWQIDRTLHALPPVELPPGPQIVSGAELRAWRKARGLDQTQTAALLGVSQPTISRAEAQADKPIPPRLADKVRTLPPAPPEA